jgi:hypothetical protein
MKLVGMPLTPWENYMNGINSYQQNIQNYQNMMNNLGNLGKSNNSFLPMMMMGGGNFVNTLRKQKFSRNYINLKIDYKIPLTAQEKQFYFNHVIRTKLNEDVDRIEEMILTLNEAAGGGDDMTFENNPLLNGFFNFGGSGGGKFNLFKNTNSNLPMSNEDILSSMLNKRGNSMSFGGTTDIKRKRRYKRRKTTTAAPRRKTYRRRRRTYKGRTTASTTSTAIVPVKRRTYRRRRTTGIAPRRTYGRR